MNELVTVIIPVYNAEKSIETCLQSVLNQTYQNLEIIVINDGSIDRTEEVIRRIQLTDHRINLISQRNQGVSSARNKGIDISRGKYVSFVDGDDIIDTNFVEVLLHSIVQNQADVVECGVVIEQLDGKIIRIEELKEQAFDHETDILELFLTQTYQRNYVANKLFKSSVIKNIRFPNLSSGEDFVFLIHVFSLVKRYASVNQVMYHYLINPTSATKAEFSVKQLDSVIAGERVLEGELIDKQYSPLIAKYILEKIFDIYPRTQQLSNQQLRKEIQKELRRKFREYNQWVGVNEYNMTQSRFRRKHYRLFLIHPSLVYSLIAFSHLIRIKVNGRKRST